MKLRLSLAAAALLASATLAASAASYTIDPVHSSAIFRIQHTGAAFVYGRINGPEGTVEYDPAKPEASQFDVTLKAENIDTANKMRDNDLKSPHFFNAKEFPTLTFKSKSVKKVDDTHMEVTGDLTIHGVTKPLTITMEHTGDGQNMKGTNVAGFETTFTIKRSDFGITAMPGPNGLGEEVRVTVSLEADKK